MAGTPKRRLSERELVCLASELRSDWVSGKRVMACLRTMQPDIDRIVHQRDVAMEDVAAALAMNGVTQRSGAPLTPKYLSKKLSTARRQASDSIVRSCGSQALVVIRVPAREELPIVEEAPV